MLKVTILKYISCTLLSYGVRRFTRLSFADVDVDFPDEKSVITYVATYYHYFSKMKSESIGGRRIAKVFVVVK